MNYPDIPDPLFMEALFAMEAGDVGALQSLLAAHPRLLREPVAPCEGNLQPPYLLWCVAENPISHDKLPENIAQVARAILEAAAREGVDNLREQIDDTLVLVCSGWLTRECGVQRELIDVLCDAGADLDGAVV